MHFDVDVIYLWLGALMFVSSSLIGFFRGTFEQTLIGAIVGIVILAVGAIGPESDDDMSEEEEERIHEQYKVAGYYSFLFATIGGGIALLWLVWEQVNLGTLAAFLAIIQLPYLGTRLYMRKLHRDSNSMDEEEK